jgi:two-component system, OmpR family, response regulator
MMDSPGGRTSAMRQTTPPQPNTMRVLVVEDDRILADALTRYLRHIGYVVDVATSGTEADTALKTESYDVAILDIGLPGIDGFEVLRRLRSRSPYVPVLILTARDSVNDRVHGLNLGSDDYLVKPFALIELEARIRAVVRRGQPSSDAKLVYGPLTLDSEARRAWLDGEPLKLTVREWGILEFLVLRAGKMVNKDQIVSAISHYDEELSYNTVEVYISRLRSKLEGAGIQIRSIRGFGYYLEKPAGAKS